MQFRKMHAMGNDFVFFGTPAQKNTPKSELIRLLCDRHYGVGADCAVFIASSSIADYSIHIYNPDGFEAEMCGNALRCSAQYVCECGFFKKRSLTAETRSGCRELKIASNKVTAEIGIPVIENQGHLNVGNTMLPYISVSLGNPHCVIPISQLTNDEFTYFGSRIERHQLFPDGTNVEFADLADDNTIRMRVWERGIGETLSCSTGSCACVAAFFRDSVNDTVNVIQPGGTVQVETRSNGKMFITGECTTVFKGDMIFKI